MTRADFASVLDLEDVPPPDPHDASLPDPDDADDLPWSHPDPWTADQLRDAYWERVEELAHG